MPWNWAMTQESCCEWSSWASWSCPLIFSVPIATEECIYHTRVPALFWAFLTTQCPEFPHTHFIDGSERQKSSSVFIKVRVGPECWCPSWPLSHCAMYSLIWLCYTSPCLWGHTEPDYKMKGLSFCLGLVSIPSFVHSSSMYWHQTWSQHWS